MAAIDFPTSPTVNQVFVASTGASYQWNGTLWVPIGPNNTAIHVGDTPPSIPSPGQQWFNTVLGQTFIYYNDGSSSQWVPTNPVPVGTPLTKMIGFTRDPLAASGNVSYTGIGFRPTAILFAGGQGNNQNMGYFGMVDSNRLGFATFDASAGAASPVNAAFACGVNAAYQSAQVASYDADGFTLTWTRNGAPGGAVFTCAAMCFR